MSYTYLLEGGEESSAECFSDIEQCVQWKSNPTVESNYSNVNAMEFFRGFQFGTMSIRSTEDLGVELSMSFAEVSRVRTYHVLEQQPATKELTVSVADFGEKWPGSFAKWDVGTSSWRTHQCSLFGGWEPFSETWPRWGMMRDGESYLLRPLVPPISESEFGYLPTPDASLGMFDKGATMDLVTCFNKEMTGTRKSGARIGNSLRWHPEFIHEWQRTGGELNAEWIEALMGWPIGWTGFMPLEMDRFLEWWQLHGIFSHDKIMENDEN